MATAQMNPMMLGGDPSSYADYLDAQRRAALAQALTQQSMTPVQPYSSAGRYVVPMSPWQGIAQLVQGVAGRMQANKSNQELAKALAGQQAYYDKMAGGILGQQDSAVPAGNAASGAAPVTQSSGATSGVAQGAPPVQGGDMQMRRILALQLSQGKYELADEIFKSRLPTELMKNAYAAANGDAVLANKLLRAQVEKAGTLELRPGGTSKGPNGEMFTAPENGMQTTWGPNGPTVSAVPGYADTASNIEGAKTRAKELNTIRDVVTASGAHVPMFGSQAVGMGGGGQFPRATGGASGAGNSADPWSDMPKRYTGTGIGQSSFDQKMADKQAESAYALSTKYGDQADAANQRIATNNESLRLLDKVVDTGFGATKLETVRNILGVAFPKQAETAANDQELTKLLSVSALQKGRQMFGSRFTQGEVGIMLNKANPSPAMQKLAIQTLLDLDNQQSAYQIKQGNDFGEYMQRGGEPTRFESWYAHKFPLVYGEKAKTEPKTETQIVSQTDLARYAQKHGITVQQAQMFLQGQGYKIGQ